MVAGVEKKGDEICIGIIQVYGARSESFEAFSGK
jgi:hypothetical protein